MEDKTRLGRPIRFGTFEVDWRAGELRKQGVKVKLQEQPLQVLAMLLEHPGGVITREELRGKIWPADTFVDFENGLNKAISKLREALGDAAENPRFVETLPRRGYRFIAPVEAEVTRIGVRQPPLTAAPGNATGAPVLMEPRAAVSSPGAPEIEKERTQRAGVRSLLALGGLAAAVLLAVLVAWNVGKRDDRTPTVVAASPIHSVVVLPLENLSGDPQQEYFADGMTDALITDLGKLRTLVVISRTSAMHYKGSKKLLPEIARELNVDAVVEGAVLQSGNHVRITAQLIRAMPEKHLWSETYNRDLRDILALQSDVARAIATEVKNKLLPQEQTRLVSARPVSPEAYLSYLKGRYEWNNWTTESVKKSIEHFQQALQKDPAYAPAWAGLADAYVLRAYLSTLPIALPKAKAAALKALELDETLADAHVSLAFVMWALEWSWSVAEKEYQRAITLDPNNARAHQSYSQYLTAMGRLDEAMGELKRARELDPLSANQHYSSARTFYAAGRYEEALQQYREYAALYGILDSPAHRRIALAYERKGMQREALAELLAAMRSRGENELAVLVEQKYRSSGYTEAKKTFLRGDILEQEKKTGRAPGSVWAAADYAALGEMDKAFEWLDKAFRQRNPNLIFLKTDHRFEVLRSDPRFQDLLRRMGLPP